MHACMHACMHAGCSLTNLHACGVSPLLCQCLSCFVCFCVSCCWLWGFCFHMSFYLLLHACMQQLHAATAASTACSKCMQLLLWVAVCAAAGSRAALFESLAEEHAQALEKKGLGRITGVKINIESTEEETAYARKRKYNKRKPSIPRLPACILSLANTTHKPPRV